LLDDLAGSGFDWMTGAVIAGHDTVDMVTVHVGSGKFPVYLLGYRGVVH